MSARTKARKRALDVLFQADLKSVPASGVFTAVEAQSDGPLNPYTKVLVDGVVEHQSRIDELIAAYAQDWTLERMPAVDRNLLRIGIWEILWSSDVPDAVAISEAVELAGSLSTDSSGSFVNGVLSTVQDVKEHLVLEDT